MRDSRKRSGEPRGQGFLAAGDSTNVTDATGEKVLTPFAFNSPPVQRRRKGDRRLFLPTRYGVGTCSPVEPTRRTEAFADEPPPDPLRPPRIANAHLASFAATDDLRLAPTFAHEKDRQTAGAFAGPGEGGKETKATETVAWAGPRPEGDGPSGFGTRMRTVFWKSIRHAKPLRQHRSNCRFRDNPLSWLRLGWDARAGAAATGVHRTPNSEIAAKPLVYLTRPAVRRVQPAGIGGS